VSTAVICVCVCLPVCLHDNYFLTVMVQKRNLKWRPPSSWIYFRWLFLTNCRLSTVDRNHLTKFRANISIHEWIIITFVYPRWLPSATLDFRKKIANWPAPLREAAKDADFHKLDLSLVGVTGDLAKIVVKGKGRLICIATHCTNPWSA